MPYIESDKQHSVSIKAHLFFLEDRVEFVNAKSITQNQSEIIAEVLGEHSGDLVDQENIKPYIVTLRKDGSHNCTCENATYTNISDEYRQFWGDDPIRARPECSHVLAAKFHPIYKLWMAKSDPELLEEVKHPIPVISYFRTKRGTDVAPTHSLEQSVPKPNIPRRRVNMSRLIRSRGDSDPQ